VIPPGQVGFGRGATVAEAYKSAGRFPDGADTDSNCDDFHVQAAATLAVASSAGGNNVKVTSVQGFEAGQTILIDSGANQESGVIATVGTPGATTLESATSSGATTLPVANAFSFRPGQTITIDDRGNQETAVVSNGGGRRGPPAITVNAPLKLAHAAGAQVSGSGISLAAGLTRAHTAGAQIANNLPSPGAPNRYEGNSR
jgi:non-reducing end alpha-L-arabinofuranosidase